MRDRRKQRGVVSRPVAVAKPLAVATILLLFANTSFGAAPGLDAYRHEKFDQAYKEFDQTLRDHPKTEAADKLEFDAGAAAYKMKDFGKALNSFSQALLSPDLNLQTKSHYNLGNTLYERGETQKKDEEKLKDWTNALQHYEQALKLAPTNKEAQENLEYVRKKIEELKQKRAQQPTPSPSPQSQEKNKKDQKDQNKDQQKNQQQQSKDQQQQKQDEQQKQQDQSGQGDQSKPEKNEQQSQAKNESGKDQNDKEKSQGGENASPTPEGEQPSEQDQAGATPSPSDQNRNESENRNRKDSSSENQQNQGQEGETPAPSPGDQGEGTGAPPTPVPESSPGKKLAGEVQGAGEEKPGQSPQAAEQMAEAEAEKEGQMSEKQAELLVRSMKDEERRPVDERKPVRRVYKDW